MVIRRVADRDLPLSTALGVLGMNGLTAYFGLLEVGQPKAGETVVVSTAAGAVGSCVGQIARIRSCRAVGIAGGAEKRRLCLDDFQYDAAVDYKAGRLEADLAEATPNGIDVYFDNTSGATSDAVLLAAERGRSSRDLRHGLDRLLGSLAARARASSATFL